MYLRFFSHEPGIEGYTIDKPIRDLLKSEFQFSRTFQNRMFHSNTLHSSVFKTENY